LHILNLMTSKIAFLLSFLAFLSVSHAYPGNLDLRLAQLTKIYADLYPGEKPILFIHQDTNLGDPSATLSNSARVVMISKGFLDNRKLNADGQLFTLCHELGHHYGGAPKRYKTSMESMLSKDDNPFSWSSAEGQSDYYAAAKCARLVFALDSLTAQPKAQDVSPIVRDLCNQSFSTELEQRICYRINLAGLNMLEAYNTKNEVFGYGKKAEPLIEKGVLSGHPHKQCRLDTILAGSLCSVPAREKPDDVNPDIGFCKDEVSKRSACWFN
jgi:hypothetical protein